MTGASRYDRALPIVGLLGLIPLWAAAAELAGNPRSLPGPIATARAAGDLLLMGYWSDALATGGRTLIGWSLALVIGIPMGLLLSSSVWASGLSTGVLAVLRSLPAFLLITIPVSLGVGGEAARIGVIAFASTLIVVDECIESLRTLPRERTEVLLISGASRWYLVRHLLFFEAVGRILVPVARTTIGISFVVAVVIETLLTPNRGVGARLLTALMGMEMAAVYAFLLLSAILGLLLNSAVNAVASRAIFWK